jgi:hypothetical protein
MTSPLPHDPDPNRHNGEHLISLAQKSLAGEIGPFPFPKTELNSTRFHEGPSFYPVWTANQLEIQEHVNKSQSSGVLFLSTEAWKSLYPSGETVFHSVAEFNRLYASGKKTPSEIAEKVITAIEESNRTGPPLRSIVQCDLEDVRRQAKESTERWAVGAQIGPLDGVFVSIKVGCKRTRVEVSDFNVSSNVDHRKTFRSPATRHGKALPFCAEDNHPHTTQT